MWRPPDNNKWLLLLRRRLAFKSHCKHTTSPRASDRFTETTTCDSHSPLHSATYPRIFERPSLPPPAARRLDPSGPGLARGGVFINKRPLFHAQLDVCWRAREGPTVSSTMLQWAAKQNKLSVLCRVSVSRNSSNWRGINPLIAWSWAETPPIWQWCNVEAVGRAGLHFCSTTGFYLILKLSPRRHSARVLTFN